MKSGTKQEIIAINIIGYTLSVLFSLMCIVPFLYTLSGSFTAEAAIYRGLKLIPEEFSLDGYSKPFIPIVTESMLIYDKISLL